MFRFDEGLKVYVRREAVDFRMGINGRKRDVSAVIDFAGICS